jgi:hypothetical protein
VLRDKRSLLAAVLVVDVKSLGARYSTVQENFSWHESFFSLFSHLAHRGYKTIIKVVLVSYGSTQYLRLPAALLEQDYICSYQIQKEEA